MRLAIIFACLVLAVRAAAPATSETHSLDHDLGQGLAYYRIHELPADLPAPATAPVPSCVVDLRYVHADSATATAFLAWLKFRATPHAPVFVLANGDTDRALLAPLHGHDTGTGIMVIGIAARSFQPDIAVRGSAADERRSYDAFEVGAPLAALLLDNPDKIRHDEANLGKDHRAEESADLAPDTVVKEPPVSLVDVVLQRAVHVHRALIALKKI